MSCSASCGAGGGGKRHRPARALVLVFLAVLAGCGATPDPPPIPTAAGRAPATAILASGSGDCAQEATRTLAEVAGNIYGEARAGGILSEAMRRLLRSNALIAAVRDSDPLATRRTLQRLIRGQIVRVTVRGQNGPLAAVDGPMALAPVSGVLRDTAGQRVGTITLSTQGSRAFLDTVAHLTGSQVILFADTRQLMSTLPGELESSRIPPSGPVVIHGVSYEAYAMKGLSFPSLPLRIVLLIPVAGLPCESGAAQTVADVIGNIGIRIYGEERSGSKAKRVIFAMEHSRAFLRAVADRDRQATHAAIVGFFRDHAHIVRVRVTVGSRVLIDVGGPHVLAPIEGTLRYRGRVVGHFLTALQDDAGYLKLAHLFTGAQVILRLANVQVMSTLAGDSARLVVPDRGRVSFNGSSYQVFSFSGRAFPTGALRISLLVPNR